MRLAQIWWTRISVARAKESAFQTRYPSGLHIREFWKANGVRESLAEKMILELSSKNKKELTYGGGPESNGGKDPSGRETIMNKYLDT